jgi:hypothetical protein
MDMKRMVSSTANNARPGCLLYSVKVREDDGHSLDDERFEHMESEHRSTGGSPLLTHLGSPPPAPSPEAKAALVLILNVPSQAGH